MFLMYLICVHLRNLRFQDSTADYELVKSYPEFELRRYAPLLVAETEVSGAFDEVGNKAFRILAAYIFGENKSRAKMEMTAPVNQRPATEEGEKMAMTAPVTQRPKGGDQ